MATKHLGACTLLSWLGIGSPAAAQILETDYSNPQYVINGVDQTLDPKWSSNICGGREFLRNETPLFEWTSVFGGEFDDPLVGFSGTVIEEPQISNKDVVFTHPFGTDWEFHIAPDQPYATLLAPSNGCTEFPPDGSCANSVAGTVDGEVEDAVLHAHQQNFPLPTSALGVQGVLGFETDQGLVPSDYRARVHEGDRVAMFGRWITDCGHGDFHTEMHPPLLTTFARQVSGSSGQPVTFSEVISRPYLVSQKFEDERGVRHHLYNELLKAMAVPDCPIISDIIDAALHESGGCTLDVCALGVCVPTYCLDPTLWFQVPCTTRFEAHPGFMPKPFAGKPTMSYIIRPPVPRQCAGHKLLVSSHFTVRHGVTASIEPMTSDAARVVIAMDDSQYTQAPLPPKADLSLSLDDIRFLDSDTADTIVLVRDILLGLTVVDASAVGPLFALIVQRGLLTDCYDPSYGKLGSSSFPECAALTPLRAASPVDSQNVVVATPIDQLSSFSVAAEDNSDGQPFPIYGSASVEWSQEKFPPTITIVQPVPTEYLHSSVLTLDYSAADTGCGVANVTASMDGAVTVDGHGLESGQAIDLLTELTVGDHTFTVDAVDHVGGASTASVTFTVIVTPDSIEDDVQQFLDRGAIRNQGLANSLLEKLEAAAGARTRGNCKTAGNDYQAFVSALQAQSGAGVDATAAAIMIADAQYLIAHCP